MVNNKESGNWLQFLKSGILFFLPVICSCTVFVSTFSGGYPYPPSHAQKAQELREAGKYDEAIKEYQTHVTARLADKERPDWENPYFYYLLIGDCYLATDRLNEAKEAFETAKAQKVDPYSIKDRFRQLAKWYEQRGQYEQAIEILKQYRELDPLMFDADIDRNHKAMVSAEQERAKKGPR